MSKQRYKVIRAGSLVREILWTPAFGWDTARARAEKSKTSSAARTKINNRTLWQKLKLLIAANFGPKDLFVTYTYGDDSLPPDRQTARVNIRQHLTQLRLLRRRSGTDLLYIYNIEGRHGPKRLHHHAIINATGADFEQIRALWPYGMVEFEPIRDYGYDELAQYMTKEAADGDKPHAARSYVPSRNLQRPIAEPAQWVPGNMGLELPGGARLVNAERFDNEFGRFQYLEYILPEMQPVKTRKTGRKIEN